MNPFPTVNARGAALAHVCAVAIDQAAKNPSAITPIAPTDEWWAQRWIDKSTPGERAAMRRLIMGASNE